MAGSALLTAFGPFGRVRENPSAQIAAQTGFAYDVLEVSYPAAEIFINRLDPESFDTWLMLGVAEGRKRMSAELYGRNSKRGRDVDGREAQGEIVKDSPLLLSSTLWTPDFACDFLLEFPDRLAISQDAGRYLCNYLSYLGLQRFPQKRIGFLHVVMPGVISIEQQAEVVSSILDRVG